jgi:hypothetical protein
MEFGQARILERKLYTMRSLVLSLFRACDDGSKKSNCQIRRDAFHDF